MEELVTLRTYFNTMEFEMIKSYLESFEIECLGQDKIYRSEGVKLQVREEQSEEAIKLLLERGYLRKEDFEPSPEMKWMEKVLNFFRRK